MKSAVKRLLRLKKTKKIDSRDQFLKEEFGKKDTIRISQIPSREELLAKLKAHSFLQSVDFGRGKSGDFRFRSCCRCVRKQKASENA